MQHRKASSRTSRWSFRNWPSILVPSLISALVLFAVLVVAPLTALAQIESVLYSFNPQNAGGVNPSAPLILDTQGNLYGTTTGGGFGNSGVVFKLSPSGTFTVLANVGWNRNQTDGPLLMDSQGDLFGTASPGPGKGEVFAVYPTGAVAVLHSFGSSGDGAYPQSGVIFGPNGNLYGTTLEGGSSKNCGTTGCGTVFSLSPSGSDESVLYSFEGGSSGFAPNAGLLWDGRSTFYGATTRGGGLGFGTVFSVDSAGAATVLYAFKGAGAGDGQNPSATLIRDAQGNLYGTTSYGFGTVFEVMADGTEKVLYSFLGPTHLDGEHPYGLVMDAQGNLYGTTEGGGAHGHGTVFKVTPSGTETILYSFVGVSGSEHDGENPEAGLVMDAQGNLYGTTYRGGAHRYGTIFKITP